MDIKHSGYAESVTNVLSVAKGTKTREVMQMAQQPEWSGVCDDCIWTRIKGYPIITEKLTRDHSRNMGHTTNLLQNGNLVQVYRPSATLDPSPTAPPY